MSGSVAKKIFVSTCATHHLNEAGAPLYVHRFDQVLPYHDPGLAPVSLDDRSWHIFKDGHDAYEYRFDRTFGFYCGLSAVISNGKWFHINTCGESVYPQRYSFAGNYQSDLCVVCDDDFYFHIDTQGKPLYSNRWRYCGDFREGYAVVQCEDGLSTHIGINGQFLHVRWFVDLDVYHKGYARARDDLGWHHINVSGDAIYSQRYANIEPFYNGSARVETKDGSLLIINEQGQRQRILRGPRLDRFADLSARI